MKINSHNSMVQYINPTWDGNGYKEEKPNKLWNLLPNSLKNIVIEEIKQGNNSESILENLERNIVVLSLKKEPFIERKNNNEIRIHNEHHYGNYCYDGTKCTYEEIKTGCFITFEELNYEEENF